MRAAPRHGPLGFTLIEVLVVVVVISVLMGVVVGSYSGADREQALRGIAERMSTRIEMARDRAVQSNREWGLFVDDEQIRFAIFDEVNGEWVERMERPFAPENEDLDLRYRAEVEHFAALPVTTETGSRRDRDEELPDIILFSSGETTPFVIEIEPESWRTAPWRLNSDGFTTTAVERGELR